ncbi:MAG: hypothetical protein IJ745_00620, partial [Bacteroidales bacterium]|nr:hypothetical protein [Bacteroidales bacterium]
TDAGAILRKKMVKEVETIAPVHCAGRLLHNTDELHTLFADDKLRFLRQYRFYICPENTQAEGYVKEKLFHCIGSGCIPIYLAAAGNPEPDILNHNAILFWNNEGDNSALLRQIEELNNNPSLYKDFFEQPRLQPGAWQVVARHFSNLEDRLRQICS